MSGLVVRVAESTDAPALSALVTAFRSHLGATHPTADELARLLPEAIADGQIEFALACFSSNARPDASAEPREALGYTQCRFFRSIWARGFQAHLEDLFVSAPARGNGVGAALIAFALERAAARHCVSIGLHTNDRNERAHAFYRRAGFEPQSEARWPGGQEVFWTRSLSRAAAR